MYWKQVALVAAHSIKNLEAENLRETIKVVFWYQQIRTPICPLFVER